jgi:hypothetical protein
MAMLMITGSISPSSRIHRPNKKKALSAMETCVSDVHKWMIQHRLMINDTKTEFMILGSRQQLKKLTIDGIKVGNANILPAEQVKNLGVIMENTLSMQKQVNKICSKSFFQLYKLRQIRRYLKVEATRTLVHAFVTSNLDYCNSLNIVWHIRLPYKEATSSKCCCKVSVVVAKAQPRCVR